MKIKVQRSFPLFRVLIGAIVFVTGVLLSEHSSELFGILVVLLGVMIGLPKSAGPILQILVAGLYISAWVGYFYWAESGEFGPTFNEWLGDQWWIVVYMAALVFGPMLLQHRDNTDAWTTLKESYTSDLENIGSRNSYPASSGLLKVDSEFFDVNVIATELGIFVSRDDGGHVYLPWDRVRRIIFEGSRPRRAKVHFSRALMNPLILDLPWHEDLIKEIPQHVSAESYA